MKLNCLNNGLFIFLLLSLLQTSAYAVNVEDTETSFEQYTVHYSVFNSQFIPADIAKIHGLVRANNQVLINVAVEDRSTGQTVKARITGTAKNLIQQSKNLDFKAIEEPNAFYAIAALRHTNEEVFHFYVDVLPEGESQTLSVKFTRKLYIEP